MKGLWGEFKAFALGGSMLDLALAVPSRDSMIGTAFVGLVDSLAGDVIMQFVTAIFGRPDFTALTFPLNGSEIRYGAFLTVVINFLLLAAVLFRLVKLLERAGLGDFKAQGSQECLYCMEFVAIDATRCEFCTADIEPGVLDDDSPQITTETRVAN